MENCAYSTPLTVSSGALANITSSTPDGAAFQFASSSCSYLAENSTSTLFATFTYGEIIIGTFSFLTLCLALYAFFWFTVRGFKIKRQ